MNSVIKKSVATVTDENMQTVPVKQNQETSTDGLIEKKDAEVFVKLQPVINPVVEVRPPVIQPAASQNVEELEQEIAE